MSKLNNLRQIYTKLHFIDCFIIPMNFSPDSKSILARCVCLVNIREVTILVTISHTINFYSYLSKLGHENLRNPVFLYSIIFVKVINN